MYIICSIDNCCQKTSRNIILIQLNTYLLHKQFVMDQKSCKAWIVNNYGEKMEFKEVPIPELEDDEVLIKVEGATINPSDRLFIAGHYMKAPLPSRAGFEGVGRVVQGKGERAEKWVGKRVSFTGMGSWGQYVKTSFKTGVVIQITDEVPIQSAASGIVNPLTVIAMVDTYTTLGLKGGIIHTAAASSLGRMLNRWCQKQKIPLLNIVRREEQAELLRNEGAEHVLVTEGQWEQKFSQLVKEHGFNCLYDALGGGKVTSALIDRLSHPGSRYFMYGVLVNQPITVNNKFLLFGGLNITGFHMMYSWWMKINEQTRDKFRAGYSEHLMNELSSKTFKEVSLEQVEEGIEYSVKNATDGKILIKFD